jgi:hypothetical protein
MSYYRTLPYGNIGMFHRIDFALVQRGVNAKVSIYGRGGRIYYVPDNEIHKLPKSDDYRPYLPDENGENVTGYILNITWDIETIRDSMQSNEWVEIKDLPLTAYYLKADS